VTRRNPWAIAVLTSIGIGCAACGGATPAMGDAAKTLGAAPAIADAEARVATVRLAFREEPRIGEHEHVIPLRVRIENDGRDAIELRYRHFAITTPDGARRFAALPPFHVHGEVIEPAFVTTVDHAGFAVAPTYASYYEAIAPWRGEFHFDDPYYDDQVGSWRELGLPSARMLAEAIPEGVVEPGGHVEGLVYFRRPPPLMRDVVFRADVVTCEGQRLGTASLPFHPG
jgi:hypothetical protein